MKQVLNYAFIIHWVIPQCGMKISLADAEDVLASPLAKGRCSRDENGGVFSPVITRQYYNTSGGLASPPTEKGI
jgi:hypothetical protein